MFETRTLPSAAEKNGQTAEHAFPAPIRGWLLVVGMVAAYALSLVDRQILSLLVADLRHDLAITDAEIGLLQGPAFGIFFALMGMPFGWLADRTGRTRLIAAGMGLWSAMTLLGGLASSFETLFLTRTGVGIGEAALVPAAVSLLADSFAPQRRALPLAVFTAGASVGAGLALVAGGALIAFARHGATDLPVVGVWFATRAPWQTVLLLAGAVGIPLALLLLTLGDPPRHPVESPNDGLGTQPGLLAYLRLHRQLFTRFLVGSSLLYIFTNALSSWMPSLFVRGFGWAPSAVGVRLGSWILFGALAGTLASGWIATALVRRGRPEGAMATMSGGAVLLVPVTVFGPLAPEPMLAQAAVTAIYFAIALCFGVATASIVSVTPALLRGRMVALYLLLGNLVGLGLGPPAVGLILQRVLGDAGRVGAALALVALFTVLPGAWLLRLALAPHRRLAVATVGRPAAARGA